MIPKFFKDMPKDFRKQGKWRIEVTAIFPLQDSVVYTDVYNGRLLYAYFKVRIKALLKDWSTSGASYGIGWSIQKEV